MNAYKRSILFVFTIAANLLAACSPAELARAYEECKADPTGSVTLADGSVLQCSTVLGAYQPAAPAAPAVATTVATPQGSTDCATAELTTTGTGTEADPLVYPSTWLHDLCWASANGGTGAKYVQVPGPTALQMGEATGPHRMVYVPKGTVYTGWTQGGWRYTTDSALLVQWEVEDLSVGRLGLICGYQKNTRLFSPAFRWDGDSENRAEDLDCPYTVQELLDGTVSATPVPGATPVPAAAAFDYTMWPQIFKVTYQGHNYCGAKQAGGVDYPSGTNVIESFDKHDYDGKFMLDGGSNGLSSTTGFCKPNGTTWETVLLTSAGYEPATFPLVP